MFDMSIDKELTSPCLARKGIVQISECSPHVRVQQGSNPTSFAKFRELDTSQLHQENSEKYNALNYSQ